MDIQTPVVFPVVFPNTCCLSCCLSCLSCLDVHLLPYNIEASKKNINHLRKNKCIKEYYSKLKVFGVLLMLFAYAILLINGIEIYFKRVHSKFLIVICY